MDRPDDTRDFDGVNSFRIIEADGDYGGTWYCDVALLEVTGAVPANSAG